MRACQGGGMKRNKAIIIQITCASIMFGLWQDSWFALGFMWTALLSLDLIIRGHEE
jgi:hypothetical protein